MGQMRDPVEKRRRVEQIRAQIEEELDGFVVPAGAPRICTYPLDDTITEYERETFEQTPNMLPEEMGTFLLVQHVLERLLKTESPDEAAAFFVPLYFPVHETGETALETAMPALEYIDSGKKHILCSPWDTYSRPFMRRANRFCVVGGQRYAHRDWMAEQEWFDDRFMMLTLESTVDLHPNDIGILPAILPGPVGPPASERPLLYSFCGVLCYYPMADDHVRGEGNLSHWEAMRASTEPDVFVGSLEDARERFGSAITFRDLPAMSRYTLCPAGWARWSFRISEAIAAGSVPVLLSDYYVRPFAPHVPWDRFSLRLPERAVSRIDSVLRGIAPRTAEGLSQSGGNGPARLDYRSMARWIIEALTTRVG
jgi:hypothetical protein